MFQVKTAVKFLQNPNVQRSAISQKQNFLRSKGLSEDEIQVACERAGAFNKLPIQPDNMLPVPVIPATQSRLAKIRDILGSLAIIGGIAYAAYIFYKVLNRLLKIKTLKSIYNRFNNRPSLI